MENSPGRQNPHTPRRRRLAIDVYFVLYLTAIVLLLGTAPLARDASELELEEAIARLIDTDFSIEVERVGMFIPLEGAAVPREASAESGSFRGDTINEVRASGTFESVRFRILEVVDTLSGERRDPENALLLRSSDSSARFLWTDGDRRRPAVYLVRIEGEAEPVIPPSVVEPKLRQRIRSILTERHLLRDTVEFTVNLVNLQQIIAQLQAEQAPGFSRAEGDTAVVSPDEALLRFLQQNSLVGGRSFAAAVRQANVYASPDGSWSQGVAIAGVDPERVSVLSPEDVRITGRSASAIEISGPAPLSGSRPVNLTLRASNGEEVSVGFTVQAVSSESPSIPGTLYANTTYSLDFRTGQIDANRMTVSIVENGAVRREGLGPVLEYTPAEAGTGRFERYVDGRPFDSWGFSVREIPSPSLTLVRDDGDSVIVRTTSFGQNNGAPNRAILTVLSGQNVGIPQLIDERVDPRTYTIRQTWSVRRKGGDRGERFELRVHDQRGYNFSNRIEVRPR